MKLRGLLDDVNVLETALDLDMEICLVTSDSRQALPGSLFVAVEGFAVDGNSFIPMALEKGAVAIVTARKPEASIPYILVDSDRRALAAIGTNFYGHPAERMTMIGVTGTNGKTSTTWLLKQALEKITGKKVGLVGTMANYIGQEELPTDRTTPESIQLQALFARMRDAGCAYAVMEVSSHAIMLDRIAGIHFDVAAFTNLTQDHLDFHKTMEAYCDAKAQLFTRCDKAVVNSDDPWATRITENCQAPVLRCGLGDAAQLQAEDVQLQGSGIRFTAVCDGERVDVQVPIPGKFTVYNTLSVLAVLRQLGHSLQESAAALADIQGVKGRVEVVPTPGKPYTILIDYAHTPDGLESVLSSVKGFCKGRLIAVFGCGGDRDKTKRPIMGGLGVRLADLAVLTSDNPRTEDPCAIIAEVEAGVGDAKNYVVVENRLDAIHYAMDIAEKDDIIVLAGKGHETYQEIMGKKYHFDEREAVAEYLAALQ